MKTIVVTGAASGIGEAVCAHLIEAGHQVVGVDLRAGSRPKVDYVVADLSTGQGVSSAAAQLPARVDGLANIAGIPGTQPAPQVLAVNLLAPIRLTSALVGRMPRGSAIINLASVAAYRNIVPDDAIRQLHDIADDAALGAWLVEHPVTDAQAYDTSKKALVSWSARLAGSLSGQEIRVISVSPGPIETPILVDFEHSMGQESIDRSKQIVGRHGTADEVAAVVTFALSPRASWLNGIDIVADGGLLATRSSEPIDLFQEVVR